MTTPDRVLFGGLALIAITVVWLLTITRRGRRRPMPEALHNALASWAQAFDDVTGAVQNVDHALDTGAWHVEVRAARDAAHALDERSEALRLLFAHYDDTTRETA